MISRGRRWRGACAGWTVLVCASCASAPGAAPRPAPLPASDVKGLEARMPARLGVFAQSAHEAIRGTDTEVIYRYRGGSTTILSVIVYPLQHGGSDVTGDAAQRLQHEGPLFAQTLAYQASRGAIESWRLLSQRTDSIAAGESWIPTHVTIATSTRKGQTSYELQFLHTIRGNYVKVRVSVQEQSWPRSDLAAFDSSLVAALAAR